MSLKQDFIKVLSKLETLMSQKGEHFRARAYSKAKDSLILHPNDIQNKEDLRGIKGIGKTIIEKFQEFKETGTLQTLEKEKQNPMFIFTNVYGIGPKKAKELVKKHNVSTIAELRERQDELLNDVQKKGLKYYEDILERIPRTEIVEYEKKLKKYINKIKGPNSQFEIVGSYRRGNKDSGDIDIIITDKDNNPEVFVRFIDILIKKKIMVEVLSIGVG